MFCNYPAQKLLIRAINGFLDHVNGKKMAPTMKAEKETENETDAMNLIKFDMFNPIKLAVKSKVKSFTELLSEDDRTPISLD